ncbi:MAG: ATP-dependent RNA helicase DeaD [Saprospiraceae bacterium]|jgi:ATP-dependent RNA helicase DeaD
MESFSALGIRSEFIKGLNDLKIEKPTEIQEKVIPILLGKEVDLIGQAQTGTGKTAAFGLPILDKVDTSNPKVQALILAPTRELGIQIAKQLFKFTKYCDAKIFTEAVYGGEQIEKQISKLRRPTHIVVATPGRLLDLIRRKAVDIRFVKTVVLDEADEMLSMGFKKELEEILGSVKDARSKWLFSATMPEGIQEIVNRFLSREAIRIQVSSNDVVNKNIDHQFVICGEGNKLNTLLQFIKAQGENRGVIFCKTKAVTQKLAKQLIAKNISTDAIHGDLQQRERDKVMRAFKNKTLKILVATDLAARGIDIEALSYVAHYTLPDQEEYYTHRSGRTARAGKKGLSISFVTDKELKQLRRFERALKFSLREVR